ncbi:MAG: type II toxin-antitoxin system VapC family toxin [Gaiellales bacterium]
MPDRPPLLYWDADVLLSWVEDHPERSPLIELLLGDARAGKLEIVTSVLSQVEVAYSATERRQQALSPEIEQRINGLWEPGGSVKIVEVYPLIAVSARTLIREGVPRGWSGLRANDAIHLATARHMGVVEFHSYDDTLPRYADLAGFPICEPRTFQPRIV